jgi:ABC-type amino acid transport substrate-binding protein
MLPFKLKFYWQKYRHTPRQLFKYLTLRRIILSAVILLLLVGGFLFVRSSRNASPERTAFAELDEVVIGIAVPSSFAQTDESGAVTGFEREVAEAVLAEIYPDKPLIFRAIASQEASYLLKTGEIHIALGMYVSGPLKTQGLSLSNSYFTDGVYAFCAADSTIDSLWGLTNRRVRVLTSDITKSAVASMFKELEISVDLHLCSSYPDGLKSVTEGDCVALVGPRYKLSDYAQLRRIEEPIGVASYRFMLWSEQTDMTELINASLSKLRSNGTLADLRQKWNLEEYSAS